MQTILDNLPSAGFAAVCLAFFFYLCMPDRASKKQRSGEGVSSRTERKARNHQIGGATGLMGGSIEDAVIAQHALKRGHGDETNADIRDVGAATAMQQQNQFPQ